MKKNILLTIIVWFFLRNSIYSAFYEYNIAWVSTDSFNKWQVILTPWSASVLKKTNLTYSWTVLSSYDNYNIAWVSVSTFNWWLPIYTDSSARVSTDLILPEEKSNIRNDLYWNIAWVGIDKFNNWQIVATPVSAKVEILKYESTSSGVVENKWMTNIAGISIKSFNDGWVVLTQPSAEVKYNYGTWNILYWENDLYWNMAGVSIKSFNNWSPIYTDISAMVSVKPEEISKKIDEYVEDYKTDNWKVTYDTNYNWTGSFRGIYINSKNYVFMWRWIDDLPNLRLLSLSWWVKNISKWNSNLV